MADDELMGLESWIDRLSKQDMPAFGSNVRMLIDLSREDKTSFPDLARCILQDASMTARVLKLANTVYYNPFLFKISTVTRAVLRLGFDAVRTICMTVALVESTTGGEHRDRVAREMVLAFHAAVQAKFFASMAGSVSPEEVFIAALLSRLGNIAFWCYGDEQAAKLDVVLRENPRDETSAEREVLGFPLLQLTRALNREWQLSDLLDRAFRVGSVSDQRAFFVKNALKLALDAEKGWDSSDVQKSAKAIAGQIGVDQKEVLKFARENARTAAEIVASYGLKSMRRLVPEPIEPSGRKAGGEGLLDEKTAATLFPEPDKILQLSILQELFSMLTETHVDVSLLFSVLMEGIYRGIGMDRVLLALSSPGRRLTGKYGLGWENHVVQNFDFSMATDDSNIFTHVMKLQRPLWVKSECPPEIAGLVGVEFKKIFSVKSFYVMPIVPKGKPIGIIYSDRGPSGRNLDEESFSSFSFFGQQANLSLASLSG